MMAMEAQRNKFNKQGYNFQKPRRTPAICRLVVNCGFATVAIKELSMTGKGIQFKKVDRVLF